MLLTRAGLGAIGASVLSLVIIISPTIASAQVATTTATTTAQVATSTPALNPYKSVDVEAAVRSYFADVSAMAAIAKCESSFTQYNTNGSVLNGGSGGMIGVFQINKSVHAKFALSLGDDIATLAGNMAYARYLYQSEGTTPWDSSKGCWGSVVSALGHDVSKAASAVASAVMPSIAQAQTSTATTMPAIAPVTKVALSQNLKQNLKLGSTGAQVIALQQMLNGAGYKIAKTGAGSPGQETSTFGAATKLAVERFQCAHNIACSGSEATTGYGFVGAKTRAALVLN